MARTVLGRGLNALIPNKNEDTSVDIKQVAIRQISPNAEQPRDFVVNKSFEELVGSVKQCGILQPIVVRRKDDEGFEIIAGERRYRAALEVGIDKLPVVIRNVKDQTEGFELALIENIQREDLTSLEEARAYRHLLDDCNISQDKLAKHLGKSRSHIANTVRLLTLDESVQELLANGSISSSHARTLVTLEPARQRALAKRIIEEGMSVRQIEDISNENPNGNREKTSSKADDFTFLEEELRKSTGSKVKVKSKNCRGRVEIYFDNSKELNAIKKKLL